MSRIHQALKRAGAAAGSSLAADVEFAPAAPADDDAQLARFSRELRPEAHSPRTRQQAALHGGARRQPARGLVGLDEKLILRRLSPIALEQYRRLAGALHEMQDADGAKVLMVTSTVPREGKTLTIANLALTLSESYGRSVLLVDADLRRPSLHQLFTLPNTHGLSEHLRSDAEHVPAVEVSSTLSVLPAGGADPDPLTLLTSDRMRALLKHSAAAFDWVLLDAPPVGVMPDANLLGRFTHGVLFVIAARSTPYMLVDRALNEIGRDHVVGTVLNSMEEADIPAIDAYHQYFGALRPSR